MLRWRHVVVLTFLHYTSGQRRIIDGEEVSTSKRYMVYLTSAKSSPQNYNAWICGGVIVNNWFVLTAAACIEDIEVAYVIAGYDKYVKISEIDEDECTNTTKRKIVLTYLPISYELDYENVDNWAKLDIALVKVDKPYHLDDKDFKRLCSYTPHRIAINLDEEYEAAGTNVIVLGWGHTLKWRTENDKEDYNVKKLRYATTTIYSKEECKLNFLHPDLSEIIDNHMICTFGKGILNDKGKVHGKDRVDEEEKVDEKEKVGGKEQVDETKKFDKNGIYTMRRMIGNISINTRVKDNFNDTRSKIEIIQINTINSSLKSFPTRRGGICQNDHGGPIVTWINGEETVIGIASIFRVNEKSECVPPFLYTSTARTKSFIECILLRDEDASGRRSSCDQPAGNKRRFKILRRDIPRLEYTDKPERDKIHIRPQISLSSHQL